MKQHPATPTRAAKAARAVATIMSIVLAFCTAMFTYQQNEISEKVGRIEALSKPLTHTQSQHPTTQMSNFLFKKVVNRPFLQREKL